MGCAAFLLEACRSLGHAVRAAEQGAWALPRFPDAQAGTQSALRAVARNCLYGVDKDPMAVELARLSIWLLTSATAEPFTFLDHALKVGDSLVGAAPISAHAFGHDSEHLMKHRPVHWTAEFPEVFGSRKRPGFDAILGNPPWISYAGRAAQPLDADLRAYYRRHFAAFAGYRNIQGLFIERSASLLTEGGRLALVIPSSMSELKGYAPTRAAHDRLCTPDDNLPDLGDSFADVFQPCMVLCSTRRRHASPSAAPPATSAARWVVERPD